MTDGLPFALPAVFVATDGRESLAAWRLNAGGVLLRDLDLETLTGLADADRPILALDLDSVEGLNADAAAVRFVTGSLAIKVVITRRPALAALVAQLGCIGLVHVFAFDSTGLSRSLDAHPREPRVGTVVSPGPVLPHLLPSDLAALPRPLVAYGLIDRPARAASLLEIADSVVIGTRCATAMAGALLDEPEMGRRLIAERGVS